MVHPQPIMTKINQITNPDYRSVKQMQIGNLNNFGDDRMMIDQGLPYTDEGQFCTKLTAPYLL